jgi:tetratricopeptide (TPR) repeat protein
VPIDRAATLRNAEKLIRQGKIDAAIAEYARVVEDTPGDWNLANTLGDLYARARQVDKAVEQFMQVAESLNDEGSTAKAGAIYKKIVKLKPDHERALWQLAEILAMQGLYADARSHLNVVLEQRQTRGDARGALQAKIRIGTVDPADYAGRLVAVSARREMGDVGGALSDLKEIAGELADKGRHPEAIEALREAAALNPDDEEIREKLLDIYFAAGDFARARECATTVEQFRLLAAALEGQGRTDEALDTLRQAAAANPDDTELKTELARTFVARGDVKTAAEYLTVETAGDNPELLMTVAEIQLGGDKSDEGVAIVRRLIEGDPARRERIAVLGWTVAERKPEAGFLVVELAAETAVAHSDWAGAAAVLQEFVTRVPNHIPALMRLVEICVDGGLEATMFSAQGQLADAYIATGAATEARFIAEDLVAREPWEKANVERFRQTLVMLGEKDPDAIIAERLSGESPFTSTDLFSALASLPDEEAGKSDLETAEALEQLLAEARAAEEPRKTASPAPRSREEERHFELSANAIDLESILGDLDAAPPTAHAASDDVEVDLSIVLDDIPATEQPKARKAEPDLDGVFDKMRQEASRRSGLDDAEKEYRHGLALRDAGDIDGCIQALERASRAPKLRFSTAWLIGRLYRDREMWSQALEWLERAAQAPAPTADDAHQLLYELADGLERTGEVARALAILLELEADAGAYRDTKQRIDRLTKVQARG